MKAERRKPLSTQSREADARAETVAKLKGELDAIKCGGWARSLN